VLGVFVRLELATLDLNADTAEGKVIDVHNISSGVRSRALLGGDGGENGPALLHFSAAAMWAGDVSFLVVSQLQDLPERFLTFTAVEFVGGAYEPPSKRTV
jgi:hypothetical protein